MNHPRTNTTRRLMGLASVLALVVLLPPVAGLAYESGRGYMVHGGIDCGTYAAQYEQNQHNRIGDGTVTVVFGQTHGWIKGYLTAYNAWVENGLVDINASPSMEETERWLVDYCTENPGHDLPDALKAFVGRSARSVTGRESSRGI